MEESPDKMQNQDVDVLDRDQDDEMNNAGAAQV